MRYLQRIHAVELLDDRRLLCATADGCPDYSPSESLEVLQAPPLPAATGNVVRIANESELQDAMDSLAPSTTLLLSPGTYDLTRTLWISENDITIRGDSDGRHEVVLRGPGMENSDFGSVPHGIWSNAERTKVQNLTIRDVYFHPIQFDPAAEAPEIYNVRLLDAGEQFVKSSSAEFSEGVDNGRVEYSVMMYTDGPPTTDHGGGTGYTNGVDVLGGNDWVIRNNLFRDFHTSDDADNRWNPAVLMWRGSENTLVEGNIFVNVDRAVAFGLSDIERDHYGGIIRNNMVYAEPDLFSDARRADSDGAIIVWNSPDTKVLHNSLLTNNNHRYAVELRWDTDGTEVINNLSDQDIRHRNGSQYLQSGNSEEATAAMFEDVAIGDLHLTADATLAIDAVEIVSDSAFDIDNSSRSQDGMADIGADEFAASIPGDADRNGSVLFSDFLILSSNFGKQADAVWEDGDFDGDGQVAFSDFLALSNNFGRG